MRLKRKKVVEYPVTSLQNFGICFYTGCCKSQWKSTNNKARFSKWRMRGNCKNTCLWVYQSGLHSHSTFPSFSVHLSSDAKRACFDHLKRYIRSIKGNIACFLHFVTDSNIIICEKIVIMFSQLNGKARRPVAHTCTPLSELTSAYQSYNKNGLRQKGSWQFDIV